MWIKLSEAPTPNWNSVSAKYMGLRIYLNIPEVISTSDLVVGFGSSLQSVNDFTEK